MSAPAPVGQRRDELAANLAALRLRLRQACADAGRSPDEVTLVAVTKTFPASDVRLLVDLGVTDIGENREQEARVKVEECPDLPVRWHFVGQLQTNKARSVARYAAVVHSVDRTRLVTAISAGARAAGRTVTCLVQVDLDERPPSEGRGGVPPERAVEIADAIATADGLVLGGVMAVAPLDADPRAAFALLAEVALAVREAHPGAVVLSAGMSADLEEAIACGATHVRIGSALLGSRPPLR